ncbi:FliM/FliN family flagellar motor switch protein [Roseicyclus persicicus]|uniref:FliM/FliN family flagellar motor switch protein n=1 Tax=Roseicyclus persicicus TaxID=2650661 RepID=A0A7X6GYE5_9RHOB|nr:FliM/FliN family flagellar motor switch protein [Roseibacterium persicicum]NKX43924.1 FliM/FliN family flagellar motor switch protein [Roseibacterium persicicum]
MTAPRPGALRRKIAAHARPAPPRPDLSAGAVRGFGRALRHAAAPFDGLGLTLGDVGFTPDADLDGALAALPPQGLVAAVEDAAGRRGLIGLSAGLVDALVEVQTTGRVEAAELPPRPVTRIDEALARDFVDLALASFAAETQGLPGRDWPDRVTYGSRIRDRGQVSLLLPEGRYGVLSAALGFAGVARRAGVVLVLPTVAVAAAAAPAEVRPPDPAWVAARARLLDDLCLPLDAVLLRVRRPLGEVQALAVGDLVPFRAADLAEVALEDAAGRVLARGRLGQVGGHRALRLPAAPAAAAPAPAADPAPPAPAAARAAG